MERTKQDLLNRHENNLFSVEDNFFVIDSERLDDVSAKLYGFCVQDDGIVEDKDLQAGASFVPGGRGAYVCVLREGNKITIHQDFNGSYGIYLFRKDDYFAISNSFLRLMDYIKIRFPVTINEDYAGHFIVSGLCSIAYSETMLNEVELVEKNAILEIDAAQKKLKRSYIDYKENTLELDSEEGMAALDRWYNRWINIIRSIKAETDSIFIALSGGFDSRLTFMLALKSGINLSEVQVRSIKDKLHTHVEDYEIASQIAEHYHFKLNGGNISSDGENYSLEDIINIAFYTKLATHKQMYYKHKRFSDRRFSIHGAGGECVRSYWNFTQKEFLEQQAQKAKRYPYAVAEQLIPPVCKITEGAFDKIAQKYHLDDPESTDFSLHLYRETRCRNHFGKAAVEDFFGNTFYLSPLMDPELHMLKLSDQKCPDKNLLTAVIYARYCRELLDFKFEGGRSISKETIRYAEQIVEKYPFVEKEPELFPVSVVSDEDSQSKNGGNELVPADLPAKYVSMIFAGSRFKNIFTTCFDDEVYRYAVNYAATHKFQPLEHCYPIIAITKVLDDVYGSENVRASSMVEQLNGLARGGNPSLSREAAEIIDSIANYVTARFDVKIVDCASSDLELVQISDGYAKVQKPEWFQKNGTGYVIESHNLCIGMTFRCLTDGKLRVCLKGRNVSDNNKKKIPYWIDYTKFCLNDTMVVDGVRAAWHDAPIVFERHVAAGDMVSMHAEWSVHYSGRDEASVADLQAKNAELSRKLEKQGKQLKKLQKEKHKIVNSRSYKIACAIAKILAPIKRILKRWVKK